jgi:hypothetical protein
MESDGGVAVTGALTVASAEALTAMSNGVAAKGTAMAVAGTVTVNSDDDNDNRDNKDDDAGGGGKSDNVHQK